MKDLQDQILGKLLKNFIKEQMEADIENNIDTDNKMIDMSLRVIFKALKRKNQDLNNSSIFGESNGIDFVLLVGENAKKFTKDFILDNDEIQEENIENVNIQ